MKTYYLHEWATVESGLFKVKNGKSELVAFKRGGVWILYFAIAPGKIHPTRRDITEDEAAMILFQCQEPA